MKVVIKKEAMKVYYYLLMAGGEVSDAELEAYEIIGSELDPDAFPTYRDEVISGCREVLAGMDQQDDYGDVLMEAVDQALECRTNVIEEGIPPRMLLWNLLVLSYSNEAYEKPEDKIVRHVVRKLDIDRSVFQEMKQIAETSIAIHREQAWIREQDRPYSEIRPIADELEERMKTLQESAKCLITDEIILPDPEEKNDIFSKAMESIHENVTPKVEEMKEKTGEVLQKTKENVGVGLKKGADGFISGVKFLVRGSHKLVKGISEKAEAGKDGKQQTSEEKGE